MNNAPPGLAIFSHLFCIQFINPERVVSVARGNTPRTSQKNFSTLKGLCHNRHRFVGNVIKQQAINYLICNNKFVIFIRIIYMESIMPQSLSQVYVHITFSTKGRYPFLDKEIQPELWTRVGGFCKELKCNPIRVGGYNDHIHICCLLSKETKQVELLADIKKASSKWIKEQGNQYEKFHWQDGYGIFSVNPSEIEKVVAYIDNQHEHHKKRTYQEELLAFLKKYKMNIMSVICGARIRRCYYVFDTSMSVVTQPLQGWNIVCVYEGCYPSLMTQPFQA
jgi:REP element-mobilizing transposase RayT